MRDSLRLLGFIVVSGLLPPFPIFSCGYSCGGAKERVKGILKSLWPTRLYTARTRRRNTTALRLQPLAGFFAASRLHCGFRPLAALPYFLLRPLLRRRERESERNFKKPLADPAVNGAKAQAQHNSLAAPTSCGILCGFSASLRLPASCRPFPIFSCGGAKERVKEIS